MPLATHAKGKCYPVNRLSALCDYSCDIGPEYIGANLFGRSVTFSPNR